MLKLIFVTNGVEAGAVVLGQGRTQQISKEGVLKRNLITHSGADPENFGALGRDEILN